jgi:hypothetical protein
LIQPHPKPELHDTRILRIARQILSLPFTIPVALYGWVRRLLRSGKSDKSRRAEDQVRQSRVRRGLRGLPPDHTPTR